MANERELYNFGYFTHADGILSWKGGNLKFGDALAGLGYAFGKTWQDLVKAFPEVFAYEPNGRGEVTTSIIHQQVGFLKDKPTRIPKRVLEIGGGRGEVANTLVHMGIDVVSVEIGKDAAKWYERTGEHFFGHLHRPAVPLCKHIGDALNELDLTTFDTILMVESLEHIPEPAFDPVWDKIVAEFHGLFITVNWPDYHPIWIGRDAGPEEHCRLVDDALYNRWTAQAKQCVYRNGSHLVLEF